MLFEKIETMTLHSESLIREFNKKQLLQETTHGKNFQFLIPSFGPREYCHGYKPDVPKVTSETMTGQGLLSIRNWKH